MEFSITMAEIINIAVILTLLFACSAGIAFLYFVVKNNFIKEDYDE